MSIELEVVAADAWAGRIAAELAQRLDERPHLRIVLPTGETPTPVYEAVVELAARGEASFAHAHVILLDEYVGLPPGDPARGADRLRRELLERLERPPRFSSIDSRASDPAAEAARIDAVAAQGLDLVLLGLGLNGHVGMNEPGSDAASPTRVVELEPTTQEVATERYGAGQVPRAGITLGLARLLEAEELWLIVNGARKADVLARALEGPVGPDCPASFLRAHPRVRVIADEPAAAALATGGTTVAPRGPS